MSVPNLVLYMEKIKPKYLGLQSSSPPLHHGDNASRAMPKKPFVQTSDIMILQMADIQWSIFERITKNRLMYKILRLEV